MRNLLIIIAILLLIGWGIGYFGYQYSGFFHLILVVAIVGLLLQLLPGGRIQK